MKEMTTSSGEVHGLINQLPNSVTKEQEIKPSVKEKFDKKKKEDHRLVKVTYLHRDGANEGLSRAYMNYAGDTIQLWRFIHDYEYEIPKGLMDDVNNSKLEQRSEVCDVNGVPTKKDGKAIRIHRFVGVL